MERDMNNPRDNRPRRTPEEIRQNALRNSANSYRDIPEVDYSKRTKKFIQNTVIALCIAGVLVCSTALYNLLHGEYKASKASDFLDDQGYYEAIEDCRWDSYGENGRKYGYNQNQLAEWASKSENPDLALFSIYKHVDYNVTWNMNEVVSKMTWGEEGEEKTYFKDFGDYLTKKGFVDKEGAPSVEKYEGVMTERVLAEKTITDIASSNGITK